MLRVKTSCPYCSRRVAEIHAFWCPDAEPQFCAYDYVPPATPLIVAAVGVGMALGLALVWTVWHWASPT